MDITEIDVAISKKRVGALGRAWRLLMDLPENLRAEVVEVAKKTVKLGRDDPRRVIHALRVGFALALVSLIYFVKELYAIFSDDGVWAVMTVVLVFEFYAGATLSKGLNRAVATFSAGALAVGAHSVAHRLGRLGNGKTGEPIVLCVLVFLQGACATFIRFYPRIKKKFDYGMMIFILTFVMVSVSGYTADNILYFANKRLWTVAIGGGTCVIVSVAFPFWAGKDLHQLIARNMEKLANFLEGFGDEYLRESHGRNSSRDKSLFRGYKSVLGTQGEENSLATFASWEPPHGRFGFRHPWGQYLKIGASMRQCAYRIEALDGYLTTKFHAPPLVEDILKDLCIQMSTEAARALKQLSSSIKAMTALSSATPHLEKCRTATRSLKLLLKKTTCKDGTDLLAVVHAATIASLLIDVIECTDKIAESVKELASLAGFETAEKAEKHSTIVALEIGGRRVRPVGSPM